jgi:hypothetical protein
MDTQYSNCLLTFLNILDQTKLYHWQTNIHARHKATDELYHGLNDLVDKFIETLHGILIINKKNNNYRILINNDSITLLNIQDTKGIDFLYSIKNYLEGAVLKEIIDNNTDLQNIRDEMLALVNKTIYLFTLS